MTSVVTLNRDTILQRIEAGDRLIDIARDYGLSDASSVQKRLADDPEYLIAKERGLEMRMDKREVELEQASDTVQVARARELLSHARWRAEREAPRRWGTKQQVEVTDSRIGIDDRLGDIADQVISRMRIVEVSPGEIVEVSETETPGP